MLQAKLAAQPLYEGEGSWPVLIRKVDEDMITLLKRYLSSASLEAFGFEFDQILFNGHIESHLIGQEEAGGSPSRGFARLSARAITDEEIFYLRGFLDDLRSGKYLKDGEIDAFRILNRMRMYQGKMRGTVTQGWVHGSPRNARFIWKLGGAEDHCGECPEMAAISEDSPFDKATLFQHPGDGSTPCLWNCKCYLIRVGDGDESQKPL